MLRILFIALLTIGLFSCESKVLSEDDLSDMIQDNRTEFEKTILGEWVEIEDSTSVWIFMDTLVKWNGYTQTVDYKDTYFEVGSIRFDVIKGDKGLILLNKTTDKRHKLVKGTL